MFLRKIGMLHQEQEKNQLDNAALHQIRFSGWYHGEKGHIVYWSSRKLKMDAFVLGHQKPALF